VHDPRNAAARGREDGQAIAVVAQDDDRVAEGVATRVQELLERARDLAAAAPQLRPDRRELGRRVVAEEAVGAEQLRGLRQQRIQRGQAQAALGEVRSLGALEAASHGLRRARGAHDRTKLLGRADAARLRELVENRGELLQPRERKPAVTNLERRRLARFLQPPADLGLLERGLQRQNRRPSGRRSSQGCDESEDDRKLEGLAVAAVSRGGGYGVARRSSEASEASSCGHQSSCACVSRSASRSAVLLQLGKDSDFSHLRLKRRMAFSKFVFLDVDQRHWDSPLAEFQ
jgi:hypothetical protein